MQTRLHKRQKLKGKEREREIALILDAIPGASVEFLARKVGAPAALIGRDLRRMERRREEYPCLDKRDEHLKQRGQQFAHEIQSVIKYYKDNPGTPFAQACRDLNFDMNKLRRIVKKICVSGRGKEIEWPRTHGLTRHTKRQMVMDLYTQNPFITYDEIREQTGFSQETTQDIMRELALDFQEEEMQKVGLWAQYILREHLDIMDKCKEKFAQCKSPTQGARWLELRQYGLQHVTKLFHLADQNSRVQVDVTFSKEEMAAPVRAIERALSFGTQLGQPQITQQQPDVIDIA